MYMYMYMLCMFQSVVSARRCVETQDRSAKRCAPAAARRPGARGKREKHNRPSRGKYPAVTRNRNTGAVGCTMYAHAQRTLANGPMARTLQYAHSRKLHTSA